MVCCIARLALATALLFPSGIVILFVVLGATAIRLISAALAAASIPNATAQPHPHQQPFDAAVKTAS
jgi:hypothetical protein